jgi:hypothetical protein
MVLTAKQTHSYLKTLLANDVRMTTVIHKKPKCCHNTPFTQHLATTNYVSAKDNFFLSETKYVISKNTWQGSIVIMVKIKSPVSETDS